MIEIVARETRDAEKTATASVRRKARREKVARENVNMNAVGIAREDAREDEVAVVVIVEAVHVAITAVTVVIVEVEVEAEAEAIVEVDVIVVIVINLFVHPVIE